MHFILKRLCLFILSGMEPDKIMHPGYPGYIKKIKSGSEAGEFIP